jgi:hypothetical protein
VRKDAIQYQGGVPVCAWCGELCDADEMETDDSRVWADFINGDGDHVVAHGMCAQDAGWPMA